MDEGIFTKSKMMESDKSNHSSGEGQEISGSKISSKQAFVNTRRAFIDLEAQGISDFEIFNALADLFFERGEPEVSELLAEAAYKCFQKE